MPQNLESTHDFPKIGTPAKRALANAGFTYLEGLPNVSEAELLKLHGMGPKAIRLLREALEELGLSFAQHE
jgi:DNA-directed RNA polymerase alpha subunit